MGVLEVIVGIFVLVIVIVLVMQAGLVLGDESEEQLNTSGNTIKQGTNAAGEIVDVGGSSALPDITQAIIGGLGFFIVIGAIIWMVRKIGEPTIIGEENEFF